MEYKKVNKNVKRKFNEAGFDENGIHKITGTIFNRQGYDKDGYDIYGYNADGDYNEEIAAMRKKDMYSDIELIEEEQEEKFLDGKHILTGTEYDPNGYDVSGYNKYGYDKYGYSKTGYDKHGYDENDRDVDGKRRLSRTKMFNEEKIHIRTETEYDKYGYNAEGYNADGYNRNGYNLDGYNANGVNRQGYKKREIVLDDDIYGKARYRDEKRQEVQQLDEEIIETAAKVSEVERKLSEHGIKTEAVTEKGE